MAVHLGIAEGGMGVWGSTLHDCLMTLNELINR